MLVALAAACSQEPETKPTTPLIIKTVNGDIRFAVEVANTPQELATGLMHRKELGMNSGMIFNIYPVRPTAMWMKNTKIPLDMLFIDADSSIIMIKENATPMSEAQIICDTPVRAVIELNAGQVKRHQIKVGDKINHAMFNNLLDNPAAQGLPNLQVGPNAPMKGPLPTANAPMKGPLPTANAPMKGPLPTANAPMKGPLPTANAPMKGPLPTADAPMKGPLPTADAPMKGPLPTADAPMKGPLPTADAPMKGPLPENAANAPAPKLPVPAPSL